MAANTQKAGLLAELGLGSINEVDAYEAGLGPRMRGNNSEASVFAQLGEESGRGASSLTRGLLNTIMKRKERGGFKFGAGMKDARDEVIARGAGMAGGGSELRSRRKIRKQIATQNFGDLSTIDARIKLAEFVVNQAQQDGNTTAQVAAMSKVEALKKEKVEFDKLKSGASEADSKAKRAGSLASKEATPDVWLRGENNSRTAQLATNDGRRPDLPDDTPGVEYVDKGKLQFAAIGEYSLEDPATASALKGAETLDKVWNRTVSPKQDTDLRTLVTVGQDSIRKFGRIMDTLTDLGNEAGTMMSTSGDMVTWTDKAARNIKNIGMAWFGPNNRKGSLIDRGLAPNEDDITFDYRGSLDDRAREAYDPNDEIWFALQLPERFKDTSAAAQNYRANMMELIYMAARLAEPSARALSDADIIAASKRIAADSNNPQVIMRRFAEMMGDSAHTLENRLDVYSNVVTVAINPQTGANYTVEDFEKFIGGDALIRYRKDLQTLYNKHDITIDPSTGRATFKSPMDSDLQPDERFGDTTKPELEGLKGDALLDAILGPPE